MLAGTAQLFHGAREVGITIDEPTHLSRTQGWLDEGWYVPEAFLVDGEPGTGKSATPYVYGPAFSATAHGINRLAGNESSGSVSASKDAWLVRHLLSALIALATTLAVALAVWAATGSVTFALWAAAALLAIPVWTGMGFFNPKDTPAAAGYTMFTAGLLLALARSACGRITLPRGVGMAVLVGLGFLLGAGTRLPLWLPLVASLAGYAVLLLLRNRFGGGVDRAGPVAVAVGSLIGVAGVAAIYPAAVAEPFEFLTETISNSSDYPWTGLTLTAGSLLSENPPWWYLPTWAFASTPALIFLLAIGGAGTFVWSGFKPVTGGAHALLRSLGERRDLGILLVLQQALLLSVGSVVLGSNMYTGLRQHLYLVPALAILSGYAGYRLWSFLDQRASGQSWRRAAVGGLLCAALLVPMAEQVLLFPYNYTYINPVAGIGGVNDRWETDFWGASQREGLRRVPAGQDVRCIYAPAVRTPGFLPGECVDFRAPPYLDERGEDAASIPEVPGKVWVVTSKRAGGIPPGFCQSEDNVTRWVRGEEVVMSYVGRCDRARLDR